MTEGRTLVEDAASLTLKGWRLRQEEEAMKRWAAVGLLCGWVLWTETYAHVKQKPSKEALETNWSIVWATDDRAGCERELKSSVADALKRPGFRQQGPRTTIEEDDVLVARTRYWCLPAGTDPRPRYKE